MKIFFLLVVFNNYELAQIMAVLLKRGEKNNNSEIQMSGQDTSRRL